MSDEINIEVIKKTQSSLGKYVKKPPLTEKLLSKPPFRFLHDVIMVVMKQTGFLKGLYTTEELNSENVKDRDSKVAFLQKTIDVVKLVTSLQLAVRPSKVVSGHEPTRTNELLQAIAYAIEKKMSSDGIISEIKQKSSTNKLSTKAPEITRVEKPKPEPRSNKNVAKETARTTSVTTIKKQKDSSSNTSKDSIELKIKEKEALRTRRVEKIKAKSDVKSNKKIEKETAPTQEPRQKHEMTNGIENKKFERGDSYVIAKEDEDVNVNETKVSPGKSKRRKSKTTAELIENVDDNIEKTHNAENIQDESHIAPNVEQPQREVPANEYNEKANKTDKSEHDSFTAEPARRNKFESQDEARDDEVTVQKPEPNKAIQEINESETKVQEPQNVKKLEPAEKMQKYIKTVDASRPRTSLRPPSVRPSSARPAAPRIRDKNADVVIDHQEMVLIGKVNITLDNFSNDDDDEGLVIIESNHDMDKFNEKPGVLDDSENNEINKQGHLVNQILETQKVLGDSNENKTKTDIEWEAEAGSKRTAREFDDVRASIQTLTRAAHPLGKLMDFLQEDVDSMQRELAQWKGNNEKIAAELLQEYRLTESLIHPLQQQLVEIEKTIEEQTESILTTKANILRHDDKIHKLLSEC